MTGIAVVDADPMLRDLIFRAAQLFNSYYAFDVHGVPCWFDQEKEKEDKEEMLTLIRQIILRFRSLQTSAESYLPFCRYENVRRTSGHTQGDPR